jgi:hypothetical protein
VDIVEETNSSAQKTSTSFVQKENEGEQEYGNMNPGEEICEKKKNQSAQKETFANTLATQDIVEETVSSAQQTNTSIL